MNPVRPVWFYISVLMCEKTDIFYAGCTIKGGLTG